MSTQLEIFNDALEIVGRQALTTPTDDTASGRTLRSLWAVVPAFCLGEADWHFARKRVQLSKAGTGPAFGYDYYYQLPPMSDRKRIYRVWDHAPSTDNEEGFEEWVEENGKIATSAETIFIVYISWEMVKNKVGSWPDHFGHRVAGEMGKRAAPTLNAERIKDAAEASKQRRKAAFALDASSQPPKRHHPGRWVMAHRRGKHRTGQSGRYLY